MLKTGNLNLAQFNDSVKEALKRAMIQQDIIFKSQVRELHRLCWTQKNLMQEFLRREVEAKWYMQALSSQSQVAGSLKGGNVVRLEEVDGKFVEVSENTQRGFDLELPPDVFTGNSAENSTGDGFAIGSEMVRLGCSSGVVIEKKGGGMVPLLVEGRNLYCYEDNDLEDTEEMGSHMENHVISFNEFKSPTQNCSAMGSLQLDIAPDMSSSSRAKNESGFLPYSQRKESGVLPDLNHIHADCSNGWQEHNNEQSGAGWSESSVASLVDVSTDATHKHRYSSKPMFFDLNKPQDDEASNDLKDHMSAFQSPSSSTSIVQIDLPWKDQCNRDLKQTFDTVSSEALYSSSGGKSTHCLFFDKDRQSSKISDFGRKQEDEVGNQVQGSDFTGLTDCCTKPKEGFSNCTKGHFTNDENEIVLSYRSVNNPVAENENLSSGSLCSVSHNGTRQTSEVMANDIIEDKLSNHKKNGEDTISSHMVASEEKQQAKSDEYFLSGAQSVVLTGNTEYSSPEKIMDENSETMQLVNMAVETSFEIPSNMEQQHHQDLAVISAAEILAGIYLTRPSATTAEDEERDQPQHSSDSFEMMTLELPEVSSEEHFILTRQSNFNVGEDTIGANKLRKGRGRAIRDFQKEILPGMVSLSRHEICEDMHNIGYELRRNGSMRTNGENWFTPTRSRRSRRQVGQKL